MYSILPYLYSLLPYLQNDVVIRSIITIIASFLGPLFSFYLLRRWDIYKESRKLEKSFKAFLEELNSNFEKSKHNIEILKKELKKIKNNEKLDFSLLDYFKNDYGNLLLRTSYFEEDMENLEIIINIVRLTNHINDIIKTRETFQIINKGLGFDYEENIQEIDLKLMGSIKEFQKLYKNHEKLLK